MKLLIILKKKPKYVFDECVLGCAVFPIELSTETAFLKSLEGKGISIDRLDRALYKAKSEILVRTDRIRVKWKDAKEEAFDFLNGVVKVADTGKSWVFFNR